MFTPIAYSHDTTREELIARFRDRIAQGNVLNQDKNTQNWLYQCLL